MESVYWLEVLLIAGLGAACGSFLNVCIYRLPRGLSLVATRSFCPQCQIPLPVWTIIPLLSFVLLRGRCHECGQRISLCYPLVELLTAICFLVLFRQYGWSASFLLYALFTCFLIVLSGIDWYTLVLPDRLTITGMVCGLAGSALFKIQSWSVSLVGLLVGGGSLLMVGLLGGYFLKQNALGGGDIKLLAMIGSFLGWQNALLALVLASLVGVIFALVYRMISSEIDVGRQSSSAQCSFSLAGPILPFGPFLAMAAFACCVLPFQQIIKFSFVLG